MIETLIIGNVGSVNFFERPGETSVLNISVASRRKVVDREYTDWISAKIWGDRAEKLKNHIVVGMKLMLRGRPEAKGFRQSDGNTRGELVVHITDLEFLSPKSTEGTSVTEKQPPTLRPIAKKSRASKIA